MKPVNLIIVVVLAVVVAFVAYSYLSQPEPLTDRMDNAVDELGNGRPGEAIDELDNQTRGEKLQDDLNDVVTPSATTY